MYLVVEWTTTSAPSVERLLEVRRRERVVDGDAAGLARRSATIAAMSITLEQRIGRRLDPEQLRVRA